MWLLSDTAGVWYWTHSHRLLDWDAWAVGQPDNKESHQNFAHLRSNFGYNWDDMQMAATIGFFPVCQKL